MLSPAGSGSPRRFSRRRGPSRGIIAIVSILVVIAGATIASMATGLTALQETPTGAAPSSTPTRTPVATPTPSATPLTPTETLLATTQDPAACAVSFTGDGVADPPMLQTQGTLYAALPIPAREGLVFAGWYASAPDAASFRIAGRVNGSEPVTCVAREQTLHAAWKTLAENAAESARIPILMYHQFTANPGGESGWLRGNYAYVGDFDAHLNHIATTGFYLPTWDELSAFIDGRLFLPTHSVIVTDDDADQTWFDLAAPLVEKHRVLTTSFMITAYRQDAAPNLYVLRRSHTHDMHRAGVDGKGQMVNLDAAEIAADMETSAQVLGVEEVMAYPFGHHDETSKEGLRLAGFEMARTIEHGYVTLGSDKLSLPTVRIDYGMGLDELVRLIG
jgi:hypothetical protein